MYPISSAVTFPVLIGSSISLTCPDDFGDISYSDVFVLSSVDHSPKASIVQSQRDQLHPASSELGNVPSISCCSMNHFLLLSALSRLSTDIWCHFPWLSFCISSHTIYSCPTPTTFHTLSCLLILFSCLYVHTSFVWFFLFFFYFFLPLDHDSWGCRDLSLLNVALLASR